MKQYGRRGGADLGAAGRNVTIKDLASELGLSITTISRALNGYSDVGEKTRKRIEEAARRKGYRPNRNAQRLVTRRAHALAWVQSDNDHKFVDPHFTEVMAGVLRAARAGGYDIVMTSETPDRELSAYERYVNDGSVDGFIIDLPRNNDPRISYLLDAGVPFVVHGREERQDRYGWVDIDNFGIFHELARLVIANGHKRFAFINGDEQYVYASARRKGVEQALADLGLGPDTALVLEGTHPMGDAGFQLTEIALAQPDITAFIYSSMIMAIEGQGALARAGKRTGTDVMVATMDDQLHYIDVAPFEGAMTFVRSSLRDAGVALVEELIAECERTSPPRGTVVPSHFVLGNDVAASSRLP